PMFVRHFIDRDVLGRPDTVIDDRYVESPETFYRSMHKRLGRFRGIQIHLNWMAGFGTDLAGELFGRFPCFLIVEDNLCAGGGKQPDRCSADSSRPAGDQRNTIVNRKHHSISHKEVTLTDGEQLVSRLAIVEKGKLPSYFACAANHG